MHEIKRKIGKNTFVISLHKASEGYHLSRQIKALVAGPLASTLGPIMASGQLDLDAAAAIDFSGAGQALTASLQSISEELIIKMISRTSIVVKDQRKALIREDGSYSNHFERAFRANYTELDLLLWEVVKANGFLPGLATLERGVRKHLVAATDPLMTPQPDEE